MINIHRFLSRGIFFASMIMISMAAALPAAAQTSGPCKEYVDKYCSEVIPGGGRVLKCLNDHTSDLSIACRDWIDNLKKKMKETTEACFEEIIKGCNFPEADQVRILQCLNDNYVNLSLDCRESLRQLKSQ